MDVQKYTAAFIVATLPYYSHDFVTTIIILSRSTFPAFLRISSAPVKWTRNCGKGQSNVYVNIVSYNAFRLWKKFTDSYGDSRK